MKSHLKCLSLGVFILINFSSQKCSASDHLQGSIPSTMNEKINYKISLLHEMPEPLKIKVEEVKAPSHHAHHLKLLIKKLNSLNQQYFVHSPDMKSEDADQFIEYFNQINKNPFDTKVWYHLSRMTTKMNKLYPQHLVIKQINLIVLRASFHVYELATEQKKEFADFRLKNFKPAE